MVRKSRLQSQVVPCQRLKKCYLMPPCLTLSNIRYVLMVKWSNPETGVAPYPTSWCSSYWKGSLLVAFDYSRQLYLLYSTSVDWTLMTTIIEEGKLWIQTSFTLLKKIDLGIHFLVLDGLGKSIQKTHWKTNMIGVCWFMLLYLFFLSRQGLAEDSWKTVQ